MMRFLLNGFKKDLPKLDKTEPCMAQEIWRTEHSPNISLLIFIKMDAFCLEANDPLINIPDHDEKSLCHNSCHIIAVLFCQASHRSWEGTAHLVLQNALRAKVYKPFQSTGCLSSTCFLSARISQLCKFFLGKVVIFHFLII